MKFSTLAFAGFLALVSAHGPDMDGPGGPGAGGPPGFVGGPGGPGGPGGFGGHGGRGGKGHGGGRRFKMKWCVDQPTDDLANNLSVPPSVCSQ
jgi:hypothetical protein